MEFVTVTGSAIFQWKTTNKQNYGIKFTVE